MLNKPLPVLVACALLLPALQQAPAPPLAPTVHPPLPSSASDLWVVPSEDDVKPKALAMYAPLSDAAAKYAASDFAGALELASRPSLAATPLADYAAYYRGMSQLRLLRAADARTTLHALAERRPQGFLGVAAPLGEAEAAEALGDYAAAVKVYESLQGSKSARNEDLLSRLARAALGAGDRKKAAETYLRVYYEYPLSDAAIAAGAELKSLSDQLTRTGYKADLGRAQLLYGARRYSDARAALTELQPQVSGDERELVDLRIAECDFFLGRHAAARDGMRPYLDGSSRKAEAQFFYLSALRELGDEDGYVAATRTLVDAFPDSSWSEEALNNLGTYYILQNEDQSAAEVFKEMYDKFPTGPRAERAAWKYGWWKYKTGEYAETVRVFENAAIGFPRSDYRPSYLYWSARSHRKLGDGPTADERLRLVHTDYGNSYYGRLAQTQLSTRADAPAFDAVPVAQQSTPVDVPHPPTAPLIRLLLANGLYDDALNELRYAQRTFGSSSVVDATIAWVYYRKGELRRAISLMRRAYPQHLTATGGLPNEILQVIFPLTYWNDIRKYSTARGLDPYLVAALIAQESTFDPKIRSSANAWGLMQIVPATGRRLARTLGIPRFTTAKLTDAETNIRLGTLYFSRLIEQFGGTYYALASYNAGESRVVRWKAERPGLDQDEFIDDIPFPETQNYVKRILGTAEDYRTLYGKNGGRPIPVGGAASDAPRAAKPAAKGTKATPKKTTPKKPSSTKKATPGTRRGTGGQK